MLQQPASWSKGFYVAFMPLYALGLQGVMRRNYHFDDVALQPYFVVAAMGLALILIGVALLIFQIVYSIANRDRLRDATGDPWHGRTLEWSTTSPPPLYNFAIIPAVHNIDPFWHEKEQGSEISKKNPNHIEYSDIHMPKNTFMGFTMAIFAGVCGFALIWHAWLTAILAFLGIVISFIYKTFTLEIDYYLPNNEVKTIELESFVKYNMS